MNGWPPAMKAYVTFRKEVLSPLSRARLLRRCTKKLKFIWRRRVIRMSALRSCLKCPCLCTARAMRGSGSDGWNDYAMNFQITPLLGRGWQGGIACGETRHRNNAGSRSVITKRLWREREPRTNGCDRFCSPSASCIRERKLAKLDACMREIIDDLKNKREIDIPFLEDDWLRFLMPGTLDDALVTRYRSLVAADRARRRGLSEDELSPATLDELEP